MNDYIEFLMRCIKRTIFIFDQFWTGQDLLLLHLDTGNPSTWWTTLSVKFNIIPTSVELPESVKTKQKVCKQKV